MFKYLSTKASMFVAVFVAALVAIAPLMAQAKVVTMACGTRPVKGDPRGMVVVPNELKSQFAGKTVAPVKEICRALTELQIKNLEDKQKRGEKLQAQEAKFLTSSRELLAALDGERDISSLVASVYGAAALPLSSKDYRPDLMTQEQRLALNEDAKNLRERGGDREVARKDSREVSPFDKNTFIEKETVVAPSVAGGGVAAPASPLSPVVPGAPAQASVSVTIPGDRVGGRDREYSSPLGGLSSLGRGPASDRDNDRDRDRDDRDSRIGSGGSTGSGGSSGGSGSGGTNYGGVTIGPVTGKDGKTGGGSTGFGDYVTIVAPPKPGMPPGPVRCETFQDIVNLSDRNVCQCAGNIKRMYADVCRCSTELAENRDDADVFNKCSAVVSKLNSDGVLTDFMASMTTSKSVEALRYYYPDHFCGEKPPKPDFELKHKDNFDKAKCELFFASANFNIFMGMNNNKKLPIPLDIASVAKEAIDNGAVQTYWYQISQGKISRGKKEMQKLVLCDKFGQKDGQKSLDKLLYRTIEHMQNSSSQKESLAIIQNLPEYRRMITEAYAKFSKKMDDITFKQSNVCPAPGFAKSKKEEKGGVNGEHEKLGNSIPEQRLELDRILEKTKGRMPKMKDSCLEKNHGVDTIVAFSAMPGLHDRVSLCDKQAVTPKKNDAKKSKKSFGRG